MDRFAVRGLDLPGLIRNREYAAHLISISRPLVDIVLNKRVRAERTVNARTRRLGENAE